MKIYIARHGQVCPTEYFGSTDFPMFDIPLSDLGKQQAECLAKKLKETGFKGKIFSSPYRRTMMTASAVATVCNLPVFPDKALREIIKTDEGAQEFEGMTLEKLKEEFACVAQDASLIYPWWAKTKDTKEAVIERVSCFWEELLQSGEKEVLLVGHGASVYGSLYYLNEKFDLGFVRDKDEFGDYLAERGLNCTLSYVEIDENGKLVEAEFFNNEHLSDDMITSNPRPKERPEIIKIKR